MTSYSSNLAHFSKHARAQRAIFLKNKGTFPSEVGIGQNRQNFAFRQISLKQCLYVKNPCTLSVEKKHIKVSGGTFFYFDQESSQAAVV